MPPFPDTLPFPRALTSPQSTLRGLHEDGVRIAGARKFYREGHGTCVSEGSEDMTRGGCGPSEIAMPRLPVLCLTKECVSVFKKTMKSPPKGDNLSMRRFQSRQFCDMRYVPQWGDAGGGIGEVRPKGAKFCCLGLPGSRSPGQT